MSKPEVVGYFHSFMVGDEFKVSLSHFTLQPDAYKSVFGDECKSHPVIWLADHEAERAADKARIARLERALQRIAAWGTGTQAINECAREALARRGKESES